MLLTAILMPDRDGECIAPNLETGATTQGGTIEEALANLQEATELCLEGFPTVSHGKPLLTAIEVPVHAT